MSADAPADAPASASEAQQAGEVAPPPAVATPGVSAMWVVRDAVTGELRAATAAELERAGQAAPVGSESSAGLVAIRGIDGSLKVDLQERFYHSSFARVGAGGVETHCDDHGHAALAHYLRESAEQGAGEATTGPTAPPAAAPAADAAPAAGEGN